MGVVVHRVDAPGVARAVVVRVLDAVQQRIAQVHVWRGHVDLGAQHVLAVREIARCFLSGAGLTIPGELARVTGLSRREAGLGNRALVAEGFATMVSRGMYRLNEQNEPPRPV